jgi:hypothetical protein
VAPFGLKLFSVEDTDGYTIVFQEVRQQTRCDRCWVRPRWFAYKRHAAKWLEVRFTLIIAPTKEHHRCALGKSKRVDQGSKGGRLISTTGIATKMVGKRWAPVLQDLARFSSSATANCGSLRIELLIPCTMV